MIAQMDTEHVVAFGSLAFQVVVMVFAVGYLLGNRRAWRDSNELRYKDFFRARDRARNNDPMSFDRTDRSNGYNGDKFL